MSKLGAAGMSFAIESRVVNKNRGRKNQPPTGEGKRQSRRLGAPHKLSKRSDVVQARRNHPELNVGDTNDEAAYLEGEQLNPARPKAGR